MDTFQKVIYLNSMKKSNDNKNDFKSKKSSFSNDKIEDMEDWRNEHGEPDFEYLQSLAKDSSPEALEKLKSIAEDLDVEYDPGTSAEDLIDRIISSTRSDPNPTT